MSATQALASLPKNRLRTDDVGGGGGVISELDREGQDRLLAELYAELHRCAQHFMAGQGNCTLQPTALVHEAWLKIYESEAIKNGEREHLLALACKAMRCVLVDHQRARGRVKRQAPGERVPLDALCCAVEEHTIDLLAFHEAVEQLSSLDPEMARAADLITFAGLNELETAKEIGISLRTFQRRWPNTRLWLRGQIE